MHLALLVERKMEPVPADIKVVNSWGFVSVQTGEGLKGPFVAGDHMALEGEPEAFQKWLRPFDGVWVGQGSPIMQSFVVKHIK
jgi:hypothetical protein